MDQTNNAQQPKAYEILSIGSIYLDINTSNFPFSSNLPSDTEIVGGSYLLTPGGSAFNFAKVSSFLGMKTVFVGKIGADPLGNQLTEMVKRTGVEPALVRSSVVQTNLGINFTNTASQTITTNVGTANQSITPEEVMRQLDEYLPQSNFLYLAGYFKQKQLIPYYPEYVHKAKQLGVTVILDHGNATNVVTGDERVSLIALMPDVDYYLPAEDELLDLWQAQDLEYAINKIRSTTNAVVAIKRAQHGATGCIDTNIATAPAYPVVPISTVGAGDSFNAGFIKASTLKLELTDMLKFANATAALTISQKTLPTTKSIEDFLATNPKTISTSV